MRLSRVLFLLFDLSVRGSSTIDGNVATNAGGTEVIRYGMSSLVCVGIRSCIGGWYGAELD